MQNGIYARICRVLSHRFSLESFSRPSNFIAAITMLLSGLLKQAPIRTAFSSRPLVLFPSKCGFLNFILFFALSGSHCHDNKDLAMHAGPPWCVQWARLRARWPNKRTAVRPWRWKNLSEADWAESHRVLRGLRGSHCHKWSRVSRRAQERRKERLVERGEVNEVCWSGSMCRWTTPDLGLSYLLIFTTDIIKQVSRHGWWPYGGLNICYFSTISTVNRPLINTNKSTLNLRPT